MTNNLQLQTLKALLNHLGDSDVGMGLVENIEDAPPESVIEAVDFAVGIAAKAIEAEIRRMSKD